VVQPRKRVRFHQARRSTARFVFHAKALTGGRGEVGPGDVVEFVVEQHKRRLRARDVDFVAAAAEPEVWVHPGSEAAQ
jgi:hypothetical protein